MKHLEIPCLDRSPLEQQDDGFHKKALGYWLWMSKELLLRAENMRAAGRISPESAAQTSKGIWPWRIWSNTFKGMLGSFGSVKTPEKSQLTYLNRYFAISHSLQGESESLEDIARQVPNLKQPSKQPVPTYIYVCVYVKV